MPKLLKHITEFNRLWQENDNCLNFVTSVYQSLSEEIMAKRPINAVIEISIPRAGACFRKTCDQSHLRKSNVSVEYAILIGRKLC